MPDHAFHPILSGAMVIIASLTVVGFFVTAVEHAWLRLRFRGLIQTRFQLRRLILAHNRLLFVCTFSLAAPTILGSLAAMYGAFAQGLFAGFIRGLFVWVATTGLMGLGLLLPALLTILGNELLDKIFGRMRSVPELEPAFLWVQDELGRPCVFIDPDVKDTRDRLLGALSLAQPNLQGTLGLNVLVSEPSQK